MPDRQLLLLRHAKAVIGEGMDDFDRPLAPRGEQAAQAMGRYMAANGLVPDLVLCSPARRTTQTWEMHFQEGTCPREVLVHRTSLWQIPFPAWAQI